MPRQQTSLTDHQLQLLGIISAAHTNLSIARKLRKAEIDRRVAELKIRLDRDFEEGAERIRIAVESEIARHESALDDALVAGYNEAIPIRRISLDGFGNRYDGTAAQLFNKLRADGRIGSRENYHSGGQTTVSFPEAVDVNHLLAEAKTLTEPRFVALPTKLWLVEPDGQEEGIGVRAVTLSMDKRDPYFASIAPAMRPGTPFRNVTWATLYEHPYSGKIVTHESKELSEQYWDHPVARWVKDNPDAARAGFDAALAQ